MNAHQRRIQCRATRRYALRLCTHTGITPRESAMDALYATLATGRVMVTRRIAEDIAEAHGPHPSDYVRVGPDPVSGMAAKP